MPAIATTTPRAMPDQTRILRIVLDTVSCYLRSVRRYQFARQVATYRCGCCDTLLGRHRQNWTALIFSRRQTNKSNSQGCINGARQEVYRPHRSRNCRNASPIYRGDGTSQARDHQRRNEAALFENHDLVDRKTRDAEQAARRSRWRGHGRGNPFYLSGDAALAVTEI